jgi:hypothetical protein
MRRQPSARVSSNDGAADLVWPALGGAGRFKKRISQLEVELDYWTSRKRVEIEMARCATSPEARLAHQELARRYGAKADEAVVASLVGLVIAQLPAAYVANDPRFTIVGDAIAEARRGVA